MSSVDKLLDEITALAVEMIRVPSRAGTDKAEPILDVAAAWCTRNGLAHRVLRKDDEQPVGLCLRVTSGKPCPLLCLDACLDTAPFGDESAWAHSPTAAVVEDGRLIGRGAGDSKIAAAIFLVLVRELQLGRILHRGSLDLLLDADEHTGTFGGVREYIRTAGALPDAVWIGYPGNDKIVTGSRGFVRARLTVAGVAAHSGKRDAGVNAISAAVRLVLALEGMPLPDEPDPRFAMGPQLSVTAIGGGEGFSIVPDRCEFHLDIRVTPNADADLMRDAVERTVAAFDSKREGVRPTQVAWEEEGWPAYRVPDESPAVTCLQSAAEHVFGRAIPARVSGPSNIGNYLAGLGVPAVAGFGVTYGNVHAANEWSALASVGPVYEAYRRGAIAFTQRASA